MKMAQCVLYGLVVPERLHGMSGFLESVLPAFKRNDAGRDEYADVYADDEKHDGPGDDDTRYYAHDERHFTDAKEDDTGFKRNRKKRDDK